MSFFVVSPVRSDLAGREAPRIRDANGPRLALGSRVYVPAFLIVAVAGALVGIGWSSHWGGTSFAASMTGLRVIAVGPISLVVIGIFLIVERMRPAQRRPLFARGYRQDLLYTVLNATITVPLVTALSLSFAVAARRSIPWVVVPRIGLLPRWLVIAMILVTMDGCNWLAHFANHRVRALWRFHELHHSQEDMSVLTVFRTHPLVHVSYLVALVPADRVACQWCGSDDSPGRLRSYLGVRAFEHQPGIRTSRAALCQSELPQDSPQARRATRRESRLRSYNLGSALSPSNIPDSGHDQDRYGLAGSPTHGRAGW